ncbi:MAG: GNAT family N-acetyltransferase [Casimicrobium sp.]
MRIEVVSTLANVSPSEWNALIDKANGNVFLSYEYLYALHESGCATARTGWKPHYLIARENEKLVGALPLYLKAHSYGEYVFDWAWADAYKRAGGEYYPKLLSAIPFTPCSGARALARDMSVRDALMREALTQAKSLGVSSLHVLFPVEEETKAWEATGLMRREGVQFHWHNAGYADFDAMLAAMSHDKRKRIKQDRRYVREAGVSWRTSVGAEIGEEDLAFFYRCYESTYAAHYSTPYLSLGFFQQIVKKCVDACVLFIGERDGERLCTSFCIRSGDTVYGRYWGTMETLKSLHFEACYYQPIEWCIANGIQHFEGGAQGAHKLARGLLPTTTYSAHWLADERFADAVENYLLREKLGVMHTMEELNEASPFKHEP